MVPGADKGHSGITAASFGVVGAVFALQFFSDVPKVRTDICQVRLILSSIRKMGGSSIEHTGKLMGGAFTGMEI